MHDDLGKESDIVSCSTVCASKIVMAKLILSPEEGGMQNINTERIDSKHAEYHVENIELRVSLDQNRENKPLVGSVCPGIIVFKGIYVHYLPMDVRAEKR